MTKMVTIAGAAVVEGRRMLLVRKRGQAFWILAGGKLEAHETPEQAVAREVEEELGVRFLPDGTHSVWEDDAGGAPGVRVRVHLHGGTLLGEPVPQAEIEEVAMIDVLMPTVAVAPSLARQIMPWIATTMSDALPGVEHGFHRALPLDEDGNPGHHPINVVYDGAWAIAEPGEPVRTDVVPGLDFALV